MMLNEEIVEQIQNGIDVQKNLETLYVQNMGLIQKCVRLFMNYAEYDDLMQEAYFGLCDAVKAYIPGITKFSTYLTSRVRWTCIRYIQNTSNTKRIPIGVQEEIRKMNNFIQEYQNAHGTAPDDEVVMKSLGMSEKDFNRVKKAQHEQNCISITSYVPGSDDLTIESILEADINIEADIEEQQMQEYTRKVLDEAIADLPPKEAKVIESRYWNNMTLEAIGDEMSVSKTRIGQLEHNAIRKLQQMKKVTELHDEVYGYDSHMAYKFSRKYALDNSTSSTEILALKRIEFEEQQNHIQVKLDAMFEELMQGII